MGVDYSGHYGLGYKIQIDLTDEIKCSDFYDEEHDEFDQLSYLEDVLQDTGYDYFQIGSGSYTGEDDDLYVFIKEPFENGFDLTKKAENLKSFLEKKQIEMLTPFDVVGGLRVC